VQVLIRTIVAIVGRPNVGKSTLFNRIAGERLAIVEDTPGVTRDRIYANCRWLDHEFLLIDTGGITDERDPIQVQIRKQVDLAIAEADVLIMVVDGREPLTTSDDQVAMLLRKSKKPVVLAVNKVENFKETMDAEIYGLGFGEPIRTSAEHGRNIGDLLDAVLSYESKEPDTTAKDAIRITMVGRPNAGKSSMVNAILGEERVIVNDQPGTTRDAIDTPFEYHDQHYLLVDTAGIRRKSKVETSVEYYSVLRAIKAVERSDVVVLVLDGSQEISDQDLKIAGIIKDAGKACIIAVNKWDLLAPAGKTVEQFREKLQDKLDFLSYAPVVFTSAKTGHHLVKLMPLIEEVMQSYTQRISTNKLNQVIGEAIALHHPPSNKGRLFKIYYTSQVKVKPPTFRFTINDEEGFHFSYQRYLENKLREEFGFSGTPLKFETSIKHNKN
jgi:GTP-binding protein